jgi:predicted AAA+ superfamily ATPase
LILTLARFIYTHFLVGDVYIERDLNERFKRLDRAKMLIALVGPRQAGKTTFLKHQMEGLDASYVLFDRTVPRDLFEGDVERFELEYIKGHELAVLDEVQYCKDAGTKLKYLVDVGNRLWITASSERLLAKDVLSHLVGRVVVLRLLPFGLGEFLVAKGHSIMSTMIVENAVWEQMLYGGYPRIVLAEEAETKVDLLRSLYETMLIKDIAMTFSIEKTGELDRLARYIALAHGGPMDYGAVCDSLDLSFPTLKKYLDALERSYLIVTVPPFFSNKLKEIIKQPKIYFMDTGLRNTVAGRFSSEPDGHVFENYVLTELLKLGHAPKYWRSRGNAEVDFVVETGTGVVPIEVKLNVRAGRITRGLGSFLEAYRPEHAYVVGYKAEVGETRMDRTRVRFTDIAGLREGIGRGSG